MNSNWNGSTLNVGGANVLPLTELHHNNDPAEFDTAGSADTTHTKAAGLPKHSFTAGFLGSKAPTAGTVVSIAANIGPSTNRDTKSYGQAILSQVSINGRKDGRIEGSLTAVAGDSSLTAQTLSQGSIGDLGFNGSTFSFSNSSFSGLISASFSASAATNESIGSEGGTGNGENLYVPGLPDESLTIVALGPKQADVKAIGATAMSWNDGGSLGTWTHAKLMSVHDGGQFDGQQTTEYTFKPARAEATANN